LHRGCLCDFSNLKDESCHVFSLSLGVLSGFQKKCKKNCSIVRNQPGHGPAHKTKTDKTETSPDFQGARNHSTVAIKPYLPPNKPSEDEENISAIPLPKVVHVFLAFRVFGFSLVFVGLQEKSVVSTNEDFESGFRIIDNPRLTRIRVHALPARESLEPESFRSDIGPGFHPEFAIQGATRTLQSILNLIIEFNDHSSPFLLMTVLSHFETICKRILSRKATLQNEQGALLAPLSLYPLPIPVSPLGSHGRGLCVRLRGTNGAKVLVNHRKFYQAFLRD
jgi:hypothetical protein